MKEVEMSSKEADSADCPKKCLSDQNSGLEDCYSDCPKSKDLRDGLQGNTLEELTLGHRDGEDDSMCACLMTLNLLDLLVTNTSCGKLDIYLDGAKRLMDEFFGVRPQDLKLSDSMLDRISRAEVDGALETLLVRNTGLGDIGIWDSRLELALCRVIESLGGNSTLLKLRFHGCKMKDDFATALAQVLVQNGHLAELHLSRTKVKTAGVAKLASVVESNGALRVLRMDHCRICEASLAALGAALLKNQRLEELSLSGNKFTDTGFAAFACVLESNGALRVLRSDHCGIADKSLAALGSALLKNQRLEELYLSGNSFTDKGTASFIDPVRKSSLRVCAMPESGSWFKRWFARSASSGTLSDLERGLQRLSNSNFHEAYRSQTPYPNINQLIEGMKRLLTEVAKQRDIGKLWVDYLAEKLEDNINREADGKVEVAAAVIWTCDDKMEDLAYYHCLQMVLREDVAGTALTEAVKFCRTLNKFVVTQRRLPSVEQQEVATSQLMWVYRSDAGLLVPFAKADAARLNEAKAKGLSELITSELTWNEKERTVYTFRFPADDAADVQEMTQTNNDSGRKREILQVNPDHISLPKGCETFRGSWVPRDEVEGFFLTDRQYRYAGYLASSESEATALKFLSFAAPSENLDQMIPVKFIFRFDATRACKHVNLLEKFSVCKGEREWLFQHYSAFKVLKAGDVTATYSEHQPVVVELQVFVDNREASDSLPLARWH
eukprot:TRINITY_DN100595_c0_g1_i1.p1 TRINITY_DN100595_c0_g1~~TRINITY_DN100595_c0_g1_i1.p1  ORF type:complete len:725 (+),score=86.42 TRINITY_DN100595_c0_g1_i1:151-2325(+)